MSLRNRKDTGTKVPVERNKNTVIYYTITANNYIRSRNINIKKNGGK
jgi:hypothetical protein